MIDGGLEKYLNKEDIILVDLENYNKMKISDVLRFTELITFDGNKEKYDIYPNNKPSFIKYDNDCIVGGIKKYQAYVDEVNKKYNIIDKIFWFGIEKAIKNIERRYDGNKDAAMFIYSLDLLTDFKYGLKDKVTCHYKESNPELMEYIENIYR